MGRGKEDSMQLDARELRVDKTGVDPNWIRSLAPQSSLTCTVTLSQRSPSMIFPRDADMTTLPSFKVADKISFPAHRNTIPINRRTPPYR